MSAKLATTVQSARTGAVVNVFPDKVPPQLPPTDARYPLFASTEKDAVVPGTTVDGVAGVIDPFAPALGVTVLAATVTVKLAVVELPAASVARHDTAVSPMGTLLPEGGVQTMLGARPELSLALASKMTVAPV